MTKLYCIPSHAMILRAQLLRAHSMEEINTEDWAKRLEGSLKKHREKKDNKPSWMWRDNLKEDRITAHGSHCVCNHQ